MNNLPNDKIQEKDLVEMYYCRELLDILADMQINNVSAYLGYSANGGCWEVRDIMGRPIAFAENPLRALKNARDKNWISDTVEELYHA